MRHFRASGMSSWTGIARSKDRTRASREPGVSARGFTKALERQAGRATTVDSRTGRGALELQSAGPEEKHLLVLS